MKPGNLFDQINEITEKSIKIGRRDAIITILREAILENNEAVSKFAKKVVDKIKAADLQ